MWHTLLNLFRTLHGVGSTCLLGKQFVAQITTSRVNKAKRLSWQDGSGEIDLDELRTVMTSLGYSPTNKQLEDMMAKVDLDGNGLINFAEFVTMMRKCKVDTDFDRQIREAFKFFDQDGSGAIDTKELGNIMRQLGAKLTDSEINLLVQEADVDGDGQVDINEFLKIMYS
ncbi:unnamed protein product [Ectocarpus sp. 12 AP-2014]